MFQVFVFMKMLKKTSHRQTGVANQPDARQWSHRLNASIRNEM
jgi:hypothetical protein